MTPTQAEQLARELMEKHGLIAAGWRFRWSGGKRQLGLCQVRTIRDPATGSPQEVRTIKLSYYLVALNSDQEVRDTILHEIAHAIAGVRNGHNHVWRDTCVRVGARPMRTAGGEVNVVAARFAIVCGRCSRSLAQRHRVPSTARLQNSYCKHCGPDSQGKLRIIERVTGLRR